MSLLFKILNKTETKFIGSLIITCYIASERTIPDSAPSEVIMDATLAIPTPETDPAPADGQDIATVAQAGFFREDVIPMPTETPPAPV